MSFDWMHVPPRPVTGDPFRAQFVRAIRDRARLFFNLGHDQATATRRISDDVRWEFDLGHGAPKLPAFHAEIPALVGKVYDRMSS